MESKPLTRSPSGLKGSGVLQRTPSSVSGGFRPKKASEIAAVEPAATTPPGRPSLSRSGTITLSPKPQGGGLQRAPSSGGFRPRPELLAAAQAAAKEGSAQKPHRPSLDAMLADAEPPAQSTPGMLARRNSGLSGPAMMQRTPSSSSGGFRPKKLDPAELPAPQTKPLSAAKSDVAADDAISQYAKDAKWFSRSFATLADAKDDTGKKFEAKVRVQQLLRGTSSKLTKHILGDDEEEEPTAKPAAATEPTTGPAARMSLRQKSMTGGSMKNLLPHPASAAAATGTCSTKNLLAASAEKDVTIAKLATALAASEKRQLQMIDRMESMQGQLEALTAAVTSLAASAGAPAPAMPPAKRSAPANGGGNGGSGGSPEKDEGGFLKSIGNFFQRPATPQEQ